MDETRHVHSDGKWLRVDEAAYYARVGIAFIRKLILSGKLPAVRTGRYYVIDRADLDTCLDSLKYRPKLKKP